jgi:hypothetical protein
MIVKFTLFGLVLLLVVVIALSYHTNKEGFNDITKTYYNKLSSDLGGALNTVSTDISKSVNAGTGKGDSVASKQGVPNSGPGVAPPLTAPSVIAPTASSTPQRTDVVPQVAVSGTGYDAMTLQQRADLLKDIQKVVRNEILASRSTKPIISGETRKSDNTDAISQGQEYEDSCHKGTEYRCPKNPDGSCPPIPDMTQYIKKDEIPCWGCSLDY